VLVNFYRETLKERVHFEKVSLGGKVILKWVIRIMEGCNLGPCSSGERGGAEIWRDVVNTAMKIRFLKARRIY
jgi:hypothetical protein